MTRTLPTTFPRIAREIFLDANITHATDVYVGPSSCGLRPGRLAFLIGARCLDVISTWWSLGIVDCVIGIYLIRPA